MFSTRVAVRRDAHGGSTAPSTCNGNRPVVAWQRLLQQQQHAHAHASHFSEIHLSVFAGGGENAILSGSSLDRGRGSTRHSALQGKRGLLRAVRTSSLLGPQQEPPTSSHRHHGDHRSHVAYPRGPDCAEPRHLHHRRARCRHKFHASRRKGCKRRRQSAAPPPPQRQGWPCLFLTSY